MSAIRRAHEHSGNASGVLHSRLVESPGGAVQVGEVWPILHTVRLCERDQDQSRNRQAVHAGSAPGNASAASVAVYSVARRNRPRKPFPGEKHMKRFVLIFALLFAEAVAAAAQPAHSVTLTWSWSQGS